MSLFDADAWLRPWPFQRFADAPCMKEALEEAGKRCLLPVVQARLEDERARHPLCRIPGSLRRI